MNLSYYASERKNTIACNIQISVTKSTEKSHSTLQNTKSKQVM